MSAWNWKPERAQGVWRTGPVWLRPFLASVPWITVLLLVLMFHIVGGTLSSSDGVLFDLPDSTGLRDGEAAELVALVMPMPRETLVFFDDARYVLGDDASEAAFADQLSERAGKTGCTTLLVLADRRVPGGELMRLAALARRNGVERLLMAERREGGAEE